MRPLVKFQVVMKFMEMEYFFDKQCGSTSCEWESRKADKAYHLNEGFTTSQCGVMPVGRRKIHVEVQ